jgi:LPS O-antigen subunit length determinant protein (WzzB/FepE family)
MWNNRRALIGVVSLILISVAGYVVAAHYAFFASRARYYKHFMTGSITASMHSRYKSNMNNISKGTATENDYSNALALMEIYSTPQERISIALKAIEQYPKNLEYYECLESACVASWHMQPVMDAYQRLALRIDNSLNEKRRQMTSVSECLDTTISRSVISGLSDDIADIEHIQLIVQSRMRALQQITLPK